MPREAEQKERAEKKERALRLARARSAEEPRCVRGLGCLGIERCGKTAELGERARREGAIEGLDLLGTR